VRPIFRPELVNGPFEDPALYVDFAFERRALLFDLGELSRLPPRKVLRLTDVFVSHTHMDHFVGFDHVLRICLGRDLHLRLYGAPGFADRVGHKLGAYTWNLVEGYENDFVIHVTELHPDDRVRRARFSCRQRFAREDEAEGVASGGLLLAERGLRVRARLLDHKVPCLGFRLEEGRHVNVWKNRLDERGLATGPWLRHLKEAVLDGAADDTPMPVAYAPGRTGPAYRPLGELRREVLHVVPGEVIAYVVDAVDHPENAARIQALARDADYFYCEASFLEEDADHAARKYHLTARQAGRLAREAGVKRLVPFHFSPKYEGEADRLYGEAASAFGGPVLGGAADSPKDGNG
jgi:ribonuclease Z